MRQLLEILWSAISGWIPLPEWRVEVAPWAFYPLFGLLVIVVAWSLFHGFRERHRESVAQGQGKLNLWVTLIMTLVLGVGGYFFITS